MDTPTKDLAAAQVRGNDIGPVDAHALSALPTLESQGQSARSSRATGSLPVSSAEALIKRWEEEARYTNYRLVQATLNRCASDLRREMGAAKSRQPEENHTISHTAK